MIQNITSHKFHDAFNAMRPDNFSYEALSLLFDHFEDIEEETGEQIALDVIAICCDFSEDSVQAIIDNYSIDVAHCANDAQIKQAVIEYLAEHTSYIGETEIGLFYQQF